MHNLCPRDTIVFYGKRPIHLTAFSIPIFICTGFIRLVICFYNSHSAVQASLNSPPLWIRNTSRNNKPYSKLFQQEIPMQYESRYLPKQWRSITKGMANRAPIITSPSRTAQLIRPWEPTRVFPCRIPIFLYGMG